ncbi:MAG TPA: Gfo/Idh/MocA family oxidoreductase [Tepidisphaeraceae bacterium]|nr:Gfo/Idh/MocA family oxidoreductase [Tepidisphaeraceae bacterium]
MANERVIVVGAGGISGAWFPHIVKENLNCVAVVDLNIDSAKKRIDEFKLQNTIASDHLDKALGEIDADFLIDLTVPDAHFNVTTKALKAGLHVVGEKPMAASMEQARGMVRASEESGKLFMVSQSRRWDSNHATIARVVRSGILGTITTMNCDFFIGPHFGGFRDEMASPLVLDMSIHHFDQARLFSGLDAKTVYCEEWSPSGSWYKGDASAACLFEMDHGVRFNYRGSWCAEGLHTSWNGHWRIIGTEGTLLYEYDKPPRVQLIDRTKPGFFFASQDSTIEQVQIEKTGMAGGLDEMLTFLRTGKKPQTECHANFNSLGMVHGATRSNRERQRVGVETL